ncbi:hypothetical protein BCY76_008155 [Nesterenkonia sp. PF2B19]|nr:hypothetical protein BCY76_008155 [Nesterenkonia sp. PF2B19]
MTNKINVETLTPTEHCPVEGTHPMNFKMAFADQAALEVSRVLSGESTWLTDKTVSDLTAPGGTEDYAVAEAMARARLGGFTDFWFEEIPLEVARRMVLIREWERKRESEGR